MKNKVLPPYIEFLYLKMAQHKEFPYPLFSEAIWGKHREKDVGLSGLALQNNSSNYPVLILNRQLGNYLLSTRESNGPACLQDCK